MVKFINRCKVQVASGGTGTLTFGSAVASFESLTDQSVVDADQLRYTLEQRQLCNRCKRVGGLLFYNVC